MNRNHCSQFPWPWGHSCKGSFFIYTCRFLLQCVPLMQMHPKTLYGLCSYAQIPPMVELSLVLEAAAAQRSQQHQVLVQGKALHAHLELPPAAFPVGSIAKSSISCGYFPNRNPGLDFSASLLLLEESSTSLPVTALFSVCTAPPCPDPAAILSTALNSLAVHYPGTNWFI